MRQTSLPRKPGCPTRQQATLIRHDILEACWRLITTRDYDATRIEAVAAAPEVSKKTLYAHFHSKAQLFAIAYPRLQKKGAGRFFA